MQKEFITENGTRLYVNFLDVEWRKKYIDSMQEFSEQLSDIPKDMEEMAQMEKQVEMSKSFYDKVWGKDTHAKVFEGRKDLDAIFEMLMNITKMRFTQEEEFSDKAADFQTFIGEKTV